MQANLVLTTPYGSKLPSLSTVKSLAVKNRIIRGLSTKTIESMLTQAKDPVSSRHSIRTNCREEAYQLEMAKNSKFIPLVPNALERVLKPQTGDGEHGHA